VSPSSSQLAEMAVIADHVDRYRERVAAIVRVLPNDRDDLVSSLVEAERSLRSAARHLERAGRLAGR
jgi:hypothetical protein